MNTATATPQRAVTGTVSAVSLAAHINALEKGKTNLANAVERLLEENESVLEAFTIVLRELEKKGHLAHA
jgi:bifunctional pyridoxal-dependent enzyme with beta-cystathionase and maltose regulon repressor activities